MFNLLCKYKFFQASFKFIYFTFYKIFVFINQLDFIDIIKNKNRFQLLIKY